MTSDLPTEVAAPDAQACGADAESPQWYVELRRALIERRADLGMSQRALAAAMGTAQSNVSELEIGVIKNPGIDTVARWCLALKAGFAVQVTCYALQTRTFAAEPPNRPT